MDKSSGEASASAPGGQHRVKWRLFWSFGAQGLALGLRIAQQIALVPILIAGWGADTYADWIVLASAASLFSFLDFGIQTYYGNALLIARSKLDAVSYRRYFAVAMGIYAVTIALAGLILAASVAFVSYPDFLGTTVMDPHEALVTFGILAAATFVLIPFGIVTSVYRAHGDYARGGVISTLSEAIRCLGICLVVLLGLPPTAAAGVYFVIAVVFWVAVVVDQKQRYREALFSAALPTLSELKEGALGAALYLAPTIVTPLVLNSPILILGSVGGAPGAVVAFSVSRTLTGLVRQVVHHLCHPIGAELSRQQASGNDVRVQRIFVAAGRLVSGLAGLLSGLTMIIAAPFLEIWTHGSVLYDPWLVGLFLAGIVMCAPSQVALLLFQYNNQPRFLVLACTAQGVATLVLCALLAAGFSAPGTAAAVGLAEFLTIGVLVPFAATRTIAIATLPFLLFSYGVAALGLALGYGAARALAAVLDINSLWNIVALCGAWFSIIAVPAFFMLLAERERNWVCEILREKLGREKLS